MTEAEIRAQFVKCAESYSGAKQGGAKHKDIVAIYNSYSPHPRGYALRLNDPWCAAFVSVIAILTKLTDIIPVECSCGEQIELWERMGRWEERDSYVPSVGDLMYYYWKDDGEGDCTGAPNHVGIVADVRNGEITVIEGNKGNDHIVGYRHMTVDGRYIRGYGLPDFASRATLTPTSSWAVELPVLQYGAKGEAVSALQALLHLRLGVGIDIDGSFGPETLRYVKIFQASNGLTVDGSCGPKTWRELIIYV